MHIGPINLQNPFILAPLAGYTDLAFRLLCRKYGAALTFSEMVSCHGLTYQQPPILQMLATTQEENPFAVQLFGAEPDIMGNAAAILSDYPVDIIDLNMGCPVRKVIKKGAGSALMRTPELAGEIITRVVANTTRPVTVKFRSGWNHKSITAPEFARMAESAGALALTIHARTWSDGFSGQSDWQIIRQVKEAVSIPVIGNGDVKSYADGLKMMEETGCDGVMIGRAALGAPWIFRPDQVDATLAERVSALTCHLELITRLLDPESSLGRIKNHAGRYFKGVPGGSAIRKQIYDAPSLPELVNLLANL